MKAECDDHRAKVQRAENLRRELASIEEQLKTEVVDAKPEPLSDNAFRDMVDSFSAETSAVPVCIDDSPHSKQGAPSPIDLDDSE